MRPPLKLRRGSRLFHNGMNEFVDLKEIATRTRRLREAGVALLLSSVVLGLFLFVPLTSKSEGEEQTPAPVSTPDAFAHVPVEAAAAIVYDLATDTTLFEKNADAQLPLASLTKLLTVYAALAELAPSTPITVSADAATSESPRIFNPGDTLTLADLARLTLTASLNDGARAIAEAVAARKNSSIQPTLSTAAVVLGLSSTYALNGSGLDETESISGGYGSARDMALLAGALVAKAPDIALSTTEARATATSLGGRAFDVRNTNPTAVHTARLLLSKTGFTDLAGGNLVLVFDAGFSHPVAVVVLGSTEKERFTEAAALVEAALAHFAGVAYLR